MHIVGARIGLLGLSALLAVSPLSAKPGLSDSEVRQRVIAESIASYPGNCPCPYNSARNGSSCGGRSAWSRAGGYAPLCYPKDVTKADIAQYRASH